ncbi:MAG: M20/M25/M40 family metallo-hydrolase, partial [Nitrosomonas sp.]
MPRLIKRSVLWIIALICSFISLRAYAGEQTVHHRMEIILTPATSELQVTDHIRIPEHARNQHGSTTLDFSLHGDLTITDSQNVRILVRENDRSSNAGRVPLKHYTLTLAPQQTEFTVRYHGKINHALKNPGEEYARSFSYTPGVISDEGVFLANSSHWYPQFEEALVSFRLTIDIPSGWDVISQGALTNEQKTATNQTVTWEET